MGTSDEGQVEEVGGSGGIWGKCIQGHWRSSWQVYGGRAFRDTGAPAGGYMGDVHSGTLALQLAGIWETCIQGHWRSSWRVYGGRAFRDTGAPAGGYMGDVHSGTLALQLAGIWG